jgi:hypothetical protein
LVPLADEMAGANMAKRVLVLGLQPSLVDDFLRQLDMPEPRLSPRAILRTQRSEG